MKKSYTWNQTYISRSLFKLQSLHLVCTCVYFKNLCRISRRVNFAYCLIVLSKHLNVIPSIFCIVELLRSKSSFNMSEISFYIPLLFIDVVCICYRKLLQNTDLRLWVKLLHTFCFYV